MPIQRKTACFKPSFAGLVVLAGSLYPIPSRTRPLNSPAPMVLSLKAWKSRSLPGLPRTDASSRSMFEAAAGVPRGGFFRMGLLRLGGGADLHRLSVMDNIEASAARDLVKLGLAKGADRCRAV